ncbi:hypothetical protein GOODEAATRI_000016 [Goodea atripinnis]|uniref:Immunoglobulin domain-containing protein n=1 Tax=Goodea atripinnis TaxID=208336 RepID=A0ABV0PA04_9TELE
MRPHSGTLVVDISGARPENYEGVFQCTARNEYGSAVSNNIVVRQSKSPLWSKEKIKPFEVREGVSLVLPCRPPAGSQRVSQSLNGDLYFSNIRQEDSRNDYICYARFTHTQTIQQKQPITVRVVNRKSVALRFKDVMKFYITETKRKTVFVCNACAKEAVNFQQDSMCRDGSVEGKPCIPSQIPSSETPLVVI